MADAGEELDRTVLVLMTTVTSRSVRYQLREIHERLTELRRAREREQAERRETH